MLDEMCTDRAAALFFRFKDVMHRIPPPGAGKTFSVLGGLHEFESRHKRPVTISEIARFSGLAMPNVSRLLRPFEEKGLIKKVKSGRSVSVTITEKGYAELGKFRRKFIENISAALSVLTPEEREYFLSCAEKILDNADANQKITSRETTDV